LAYEAQHRVIGKCCVRRRLQANQSMRCRAQNKEALNDMMKASYVDYGLRILDD